MRSLIRALYRNRRRAGITFVCFFVMGAVNTVIGDGALHILRAVFVGTALGLIMTTGLMILALLIPAWRALMEIAGACSLLMLGLNAVAPSLLTGGSAVQSMIIGWVVCMGVGALYAGPTLDRFALRENVHHRGAAKTPLPQKTVWTGLYGLPEDVAQRHEGDAILVYEAVADQPDTYRIVERTQDRLQIEEFQRMELRDAPHSIRFRWWVPGASAGAPFSCGTLSAMLTETRQAGTRIETTHCVDLMPSRMVLFAWVDDHFGRTLDGHLKSLEQNQTLQGTDPKPIEAT